MKLATLIQSMRPNFLVLTPVCIFLGASIVASNQGIPSYKLLLLVLLGALMAHISVNTLNEYFDFKSGLDLSTQRTPFSGGSGALPQNPQALRSVLVVGVLSSVVTVVIGAYFILTYGTGIIPIGVMGLLLVVSYTPWINRHPLLCLLAPGIGFGFLMVGGTQFVLEGEYVTQAWLIAAIPFFLVNNLLLLNQYPDIDADTRVGRNHFPIAYGINRSNMVYGLFTSATIVAILLYVQLGVLPSASLFALAPMPLALFALYGAVKHGKNIGSAPQYLGANVAATLLTPMVLGVMMIVS